MPNKAAKAKIIKVNKNTFFNLRRKNEIFKFCCCSLFLEVRKYAPKNNNKAKINKPLALINCVVKFIS